MTCPTGFGTKTLHFDGKGVTDTRGCGVGTCACGTPSGGTCDCGTLGCTVDLYTDDNCMVALSTVPTNGVCTAVATQPNSIKIIGGTAKGGQCAPSGAAQSKGSAIPTGVLTLCCAP
jgi:hypothetical protein